MICPCCKSEIPEGQIRCPRCGAFLQVQIQPRPVQQQMPQMQQRPMIQPNPQQPQMQQPVKKGNKGILIAGIIAGILVLVAAGLFLFILFGEDTATKGKTTVPSTTGDSDNPHQGQTNDPPTTVATPDPNIAASKTIMIYMIGSDLESESGAATDDIYEILEADVDSNCQIVLQTGGCSYWYHNMIQDNKVQRFQIKNHTLTELENLGSMSMVDENSLTDFIQYASTNFPAEDYILVLWDHGGSVPISFGYDELDPNETLDDVELGYALDNAGVHFETVIFDACNMCTLEVAMALRDNTDYMIAAESYVSGIGLYYTDWLTAANETGADAEDYGEKIVTGYMESLKEISSVGSMSIISMDKIDAVYSAYVDYIISVDQAVKAGDYAGYVKTRGNCGLYSGTDSVDIITLATEYSTDHSSKLINAVVNAVSYTESDFLYGHGMAVYSPYSYSEYYEYARASLESLQYDEKIISFYDSFVSVQMSYLGEAYVSDFTGDWYDGETADSYVESGTEAGTYSLETTRKDGYDAICLSEEDWEIVDTIMVSCTIFDDEMMLMLGQDYYSDYDDDGDIIIKNPDYWVYINNSPACYIGYDSYVDDATGDWSQSGGVLALRNGQEIMISLYFDKDYPYGTVLGYVPYDFETDQTEEGKYYQFNDNDQIDLVYMVSDVNTGKITYETLDEPFSASSIEVSYSSVDFSTSSTMVYYTIYDIYGNAYETETFEMK